MAIEMQNPLAVTNVKDSQGSTVPNGGTTPDTTLDLSGTAPANTVAFILDNGEVVGTTSVTIAGTWAISLNALAPGEHRFNVRAIDATLSPPWVVTVGVVVVVPVITRITDVKGDLIPEEGTTTDTSVTIYGTAAPGSMVEIFDGSGSWGGADAPQGNWTKTLQGLITKPYSITAMGRYDNSPVSEPRTFIVLKLQDFKCEVERVIPANTLVRFYSGLTLITSSHLYHPARVVGYFEMLSTGSGITDRFTLTEGANFIEIDLYASNGLSNAVEFFDAGNTLIERKALEWGNHRRVVVFNSPRRCTFFVMTVSEDSPTDTGIGIHTIAWGSR